MSFALRTLADGLLAATTSAAVLAWRGRRESAGAAAPINAISHWLWPRRALREDGASLRHTGSGTAIHYASSMLWAAVFRGWRQRRPRPTPANAVLDAAAVTAVAALVDLKLTPRRFTPGFEQRLSPRGLAWVYAGFALGLALGGLAGQAPALPRQRT